jgi:hypothetical protein
MPERAPKGASARNPAQPQSGLAAEEYAALEATLSGTPMGRWFLAEYMRRHPTPETQLMLDAIARLEATVLKPQHQAGFAGMLGELREIALAIARARREISQLHRPDDGAVESATDELDQIAKATSEILSAAENIQEVARALRQIGVAPGFCDRLDHHAIDIRTACSFQDLAEHRIDKAVHTLRLIEGRIGAAIAVWGGDDAGKPYEGRSPVPPATPAEPGLERRQEPHEAALARDHVDQPLAHGEWEAPRTSEAGKEPPLGPRKARFEFPDPLTLSQLDAAKRGALFG